jgi:hypothetical protein
MQSEGGQDMTIAKITVLVMGFPPSLRQAQPLPGETRAQMVIRLHPRQWENFVDRLKSSNSTTSDVWDRLLQGDLSVMRDNVEKHIEEFMNMRLPTHWRTLHDLADLRRYLNDPSMQQMHGC